MAITCSNCHFAGNADSAATCQVCGASLLSTPQSGYSASLGIPPACSAGAATSAGGSAGVPPPSSATPHAPPISTAAPTVTPAVLTLAGPITWLEQTSENADLNLFRLGSQIIMMLILLPLLVVIFAAGFLLWIALSIVGFHGMARDFSPFALINTMTSFGILAAVIFPRVPRCDQVPTIRLTVRTNSGEQSAMIKGVLTSGTLRQGDDISLNGIWRNGTLIVRDGYNYTLTTALQLRRDYWHIAFFVLLVLIISLVAFGNNSWIHR